MDEPKLKLTPDESRLFGQLFKEADSDSTGFVTGEVAVNFFGRTNLPQQVLGAIWDLVDPENRGFLMQDDFAKAMRLIGYSQANPTRPLDPSLALKPAPLPQFQGFSIPTAIRVPPLSPDDAAKYMRLFEQSGAVNGVIGGEVARSFFMRSGLPNDILIAVWNLADASQRGALGATEFIVAMHLLSSYKSGSMTALPKQCPPALFEAAARMAARPAPTPAATVPRQFSGVAGTQRVASPASRVAGSPAIPPPSDWLVAADKPSFDEAFDKLDTQRTGLVAADQAATYFRNSGLPDGTLAQIWDLANIRKADQLNRDEFAVAMYLIRTQRSPDRRELPQVLPTALIPPSLRSFVGQQSVVAPGPPAPQPPPVQAPVQKSAAEDLFGLDELTSSPVAPVAQQSTGGSTAFGDLFGSRAPPPVASPPTSSTAPRGFKPFIPTSTFGQGLTVQSTGGSAASQPTTVRSPPAPQASTMDDLLGDADPEVSKKLTQDTAELANMSNQIGQLRNQMQDVSSKKTASERDFSSTSTQKRDLELRLSQFRTQYEAEVKAVKEIEQQLSTVRTETQNLQRELAMVEGSFHDLQNQHQQATVALETERRDNAALKDRMTQLNQEIARLRPEVEKMRSDARHEKGMASINKKQLEKSEAERDSLNTERRSLQEQAAAPANQEASRSSPVASPQGQSTNPFFRRSPQPSIDAGMAPGNFARNQPVPVPTSQFDSLWDSAFTPTGTAKGAPPTSFAFGAASGLSQSSHEPAVMTPSTSPPASSYKDSPKPSVPEPPASRQITSQDLPIRGSGAESSVSMRVGTPSSRMDGTATPTATSVASANAPQLERSGTAGSTGASLFDRARAASPVASVTSQTSKTQTRFGEASEPSRTLSAGPTGTGTIPGAFPGTQTSPIQSQLTGESSFTTGSKDTRETPFSVFSAGSSREQPKSSSATTSDFDSAFASRTTTGNLTDPLRKTTQTREPDAFGTRFPPVNSLVHEDDDSDSEPEGFDDDFTAPSPGKPKITSAGARTEEPRAEASQPRTAVAASPDDLPPITAQKSPPEYVASPEGPSGKLSESTSNSFPPEFGGLLPQRELSMSPPQPAQSPSQGAALFGGAPVSKVSETTPSSTARSGDFHSAASQASAPSIGPTTHFGSNGNPAKQSVASFGGDDEFDGFDELEDARPDDEKDDELFSSRNEHAFETFDPTFDSPIASKSNTLASDFDAGFGKSSTATLPSNLKSSTTDWDSFMTSSTSRPAESSGMGSSTHGSRLFSDPPPASSSNFSAPPPEAPEPPKLNRGISMGTEHDDPILKQLTGMGFDRQKALDSLEKYDYNLDKAIEHLSKTR